jgi:hypothetical protein
VLVVIRRTVFAIWNRLDLRAGNDLPGAPEAGRFLGVKLIGNQMV